MKIFFDRSVNVLGCYDSLAKAQDAVTGLEWNPLCGEQNVQYPIDNSAAAAKPRWFTLENPSDDRYVIREFL